MKLKLWEKIKKAGDKIASEAEFKQADIRRIILVALGARQDLTPEEAEELKHLKFAITKWVAAHTTSMTSGKK